VTGHSSDVALRLATAMFMATVVAMASSCGGANGDTAQERNEIRASFATLNERLVERDPVGICRWMTRVAQRQIGSIGHQAPTSCTKDVREFLRSERRPVHPRIDGISIDGDRAIVVAGYDADQAGAFVFEEEADRWKLGTVFSTTATAPDDLGTPVEGLPSIGAEEAAGPRSMTLPVHAEGRGAHCRAVEVKELEVRGGCELVANALKARFRLKTLFGDSWFATCKLSFTMRVDGAGRIGVDEASIEQALGAVEGPCGDIQRCRIRSTGETPWEYNRPWRGRIRSTSDARLIAEIDLCFDSCAGRLQGRTAIPMTRDERGWRLEAADAAVGRSGLSVSGTWRLTPDWLRIANPPNRQASS
jgi:hypothetical protein